MEKCLAVSDISDLYRSHHRWLVTWLFGRVRCRENAADLAQDTFLRLIGRQDYLQLKNPRAYLATIARGLAIDLARRHAVEQAYLDVLSQSPAKAAPPEEERLDLLQCLSRIDRVLQELPPRARNAFILSRLEGRSHREIATTFRVSISTIEKDIAKALRCCYHARYRS